MWSLKSEFHDMSSAYLILPLNLPRTKPKKSRFVGMLSIAIHCGSVPWTSEFQVWLVSKHMPCTKSAWAAGNANQSVKRWSLNVHEARIEGLPIHAISTMIHPQFIMHPSSWFLPRSSKWKVSGTLNFDRTQKTTRLASAKLAVDPVQVAMVLRKSTEWCEVLLDMATPVKPWHSDSIRQVSAKVVDVSGKHSAATF